MPKKVKKYNGETCLGREAAGGIDELADQVVTKSKNKKGRELVRGSP